MPIFLAISAACGYINKNWDIQIISSEEMQGQKLQKQHPKVHPVGKHWPVDLFIVDAAEPYRSNTMLD